MVGARRKYSAVELGVQGSPVCALVELMEADCGLGDEQDVVGVETCATEPSGMTEQSVSR